MRLGISSYTYVWAAGVPGYEQPRNRLTHTELLHKAVDLGVHVVQIADNMPLDRLSTSQLDELAALAREKDIYLEVGTWGIEPSVLRTYLEIAKTLISPIVRTVIDAEHFATYEDAIASIKSVLPEYAQAGVTLALENHDSIAAADLADIVKQCNSRHVGVCFDTTNSLGCGEDLRTTLASLGTFVVNVHYKDFVAHRLPHKKGFIVEGCAAGDGLVNLFDLLGGLRRERRIDVNVILELWPPPEPTLEQSIAKEDAWARKSIQFLRQYFLK
jgi:sugar phosphate isomerase/epimerase